MEAKEWSSTVTTSPSTDEPEERGFAALMRAVAAGQWWRRSGSRSAYGVARVSRHQQRGSRGVGVKDGTRRIQAHFDRMDAFTPRLKEGRVLAKGRAMQKRLQASRAAMDRGKRAA